MYTDDVRTVRVVCCDKDGEKGVGLGCLLKRLAQDPALECADLPGLKEWEHGRMCSEL